MVSRQTIQRLIATSRLVFRQCASPNGAIVAARPDLPNYPRDVQSYGFVWIRDAAFVCAAAHRVGLHDIQEPFYRWVLERAERTRSGLLLNAYFPNGVGAGVIVRESASRRDQRLPQALTLSAQIQPDALGTLLWALADHRRFTPLTAGSRRLASDVADSLVAHWSGRSFTVPTWDIWEATPADPRRGQTLTYSLAMAIRGLEAAESILGRRLARQRAIASMRVVLERAYDAQRRCFTRCFGRRTKDTTLDASLLGLVFPAQQVAADDPRMTATVQCVLQRCRIQNGLVRYPGDRYSGRMARGRLVLDGAGAWPWLSAWAAIVLTEQGRVRDAKREIAPVWRLLRHGPLPEQVHADGRASVTGLAAPHAFVVFAAERLELLGHQR